MVKSRLLHVLRAPVWLQVGISRKGNPLCHNTYVPKTTWLCHFEAVWFQMYILTTKAFNCPSICHSNHSRLTNWNSVIRLLSLLVQIQHQKWFITKIGGGFLLLAVLLRLALVEESQNHVALLLSELYKEVWIYFPHQQQQQATTVQSIQKQLRWNS